MAMFDSAIFDGALFDVGSGGGGGTNLFNPQLTDPPPDWEGFNVTITGGATDSSGGTTAVAIRETAGNTQFNFGGGAYVDIPSGETLTLRFRLKSVGSRSIYLLLTDFDLFSSNAVFDMVSITATPGSGVTASITAAGVGFYDIELSYVLTTDVTAAAGVYGIIRFMDDTGSESYAGNTSSGFDIESASLSLDSASPPAAATLAVSSASITLTGGPVAIRAARKLPVASRSIMTTGQAVAARYGRKAGVSSVSVALSGGPVGLTHTPSGPAGSSQRDSDPIWRKFVPEIPELAEIEEVIEEEAAKPRRKSRKVKREVAKRIIDLTGLGGLLGEKVPPVVYRQVDRALSLIEQPNTDQTLIYVAIRLAVIRAIEEDDEEDDMMAILMVA